MAGAVGAWRYAVTAEELNLPQNRYEQLADYVKNNSLASFARLQQAAREMILGAVYVRSVGPGSPAFSAGLIVFRDADNEFGHFCVVYAPQALLPANDPRGGCGALAVVLLQMCYGRTLPHHLQRSAVFRQNLRLLLTRKIDTAEQDKTHRSLPSKFDCIVEQRFMDAEMKPSKKERVLARLLNIAKYGRSYVELPMDVLKLIKKLLDAGDRVPVLADADLP